MIDFYLKKNLQIADIYLFISHITGYPRDKILILTLDEADNFPQSINLENICCFCVVSKRYGDASMFISIHKLNMDYNDLISNIINYSINNKIPCYIPYDNFEGYLLTGLSRYPIKMKRIYLEEGNDEDEELLIFIPEETEESLY